MVNENGYLTLIDFGVSKKIKSGETTETVIGTLEYMSPELMKEKEYNRSVDWWALGIILYELLIGVSPFRVSKRNMGDVAYKQSVLKSKVKFPDRTKFKIEYSDNL